MMGVLSQAYLRGIPPYLAKSFTTLLLNKAFGELGRVPNDPPTFMQVLWCALGVEFWFLKIKILVFDEEPEFVPSQAFSDPFSLARFDKLYSFLHDF